MVSMVTVQMGNEKAVRLGDSINGDLGKAAQGGCMAPCRGGVIISHHRQKVLGDRDLEDAGAPERGMRHAGRENHSGQSPCKGRCMACGPCSPVASPHGDDGEFGQDDGTTDGHSYLFGALTPR